MTGALKAVGRMRRGVAVLALGVLAVSFGPNLAESVRSSRDALRFNDDARQQIWPFLAQRDPALFQNDYLAAYQRKLVPVGFAGLYGLTARVIDPRALSKIIPFVLLAALVAAAWCVGHRLGGLSAAWGAAAICLSNGAYFASMGGGLPRAFGYPLLAVAALALVNGMPLTLIAVTLLGALLYYPVAVISGVALALLLWLPARWGGLDAPWSVRRRLLTVGGTAAATALLLLPNVTGLQHYGPSVGPSGWSQYPEAGPDGRFAEYDVVGRTPVTEIPRTWARVLVDGIRDRRSSWGLSISAFGKAHGRPVAIAFLGVFALGLARLTQRDLRARRVLLLAVAGLCAYVLAWVAVPFLYVPGRYVTLTLPLIFALTFPASVGALAASARRAGVPWWGKDAFTVVGSMLFVLLLGGSGTTDGAANIRVTPEQEPLYEFVSRLPPNALVAGWPTTMDDIPYVAKRKVLITRELHLAYHERYLAEMRRRMIAIVAAYFANDLDPLVRLRESFGVTHLILDLRHFVGSPPRYFAPFQPAIDHAVAQLDRDSERLRQRRTSEVYRGGSFVVLDLSKVAVDSESRLREPSR